MFFLSNMNTFDYDAQASEAELASGSFTHLIDCDDEDFGLVQSLTNEGEYLGRRLTTNKAVPGNIHKQKYRSFWKEVLKPSKLVMDTIEQGYSLPFESVPPPSFEKNNRSAREDMSFVRQEVKRLEALGCIERVSNRPRCVLPLSSVFSKKKRVVVDGSRCLNPYLKHRRVRLQDLRDIKEVVKKNGYYFTDDIDSAYWHLAIKPEFRTFLGIHIEEEDGSISFFVWRVMFLGISDAVFIFTAMLKPCHSFVRSLGIPNIIFIDDHFTGGATEDLAIKNNALANKVLASAGWVISSEKKVGPLQRIRYLGLEVCSVSMMFYIPDDKLTRLLESIDSLLSSKKVKLRALSSFLGLLQSCARALGPIVRLMSRYAYLFLMSNVDRYSWNFFLPLEEDVRHELKFWRNNLFSLNGFSFSPNLSMIDIQQEVIADASGIGIFGYRFFSNDYEIVLRRLLSNEEAKKNSTYRELKAIHEIYTGSDAVKFENSIVRHSCDNQAAVDIIVNGSRRPNLHAMAVDIYLNCKKLNITLYAEWKPRNHPLLVHADWGSRMFDQSSYSLNFESFYAMLEFFKFDIDVDAMADYWNRKCSVYFSRFPDPHSKAVNFFAQGLSRSLKYYCFPPPSLYTAVVLHMASHEVSGLILVPVWKSAAYWSNVVPDGQHLAFWAKRFLIFRPSGFVYDPNIISNTFKTKPVTFDMLAIQVDFSSSLGKDLFSSAVCQNNCIDYGCVKCLHNV